MKERNYSLIGNLKLSAKIMFLCVDKEAESTSLYIIHRMTCLTLPETLPAYICCLSIIINSVFSQNVLIWKLNYVVILTTQDSLMANDRSSTRLATAWISFWVPSLKVRDTTSSIWKEWRDSIYLYVGASAFELGRLLYLIIGKGEGPFLSLIFP